MDNNPAATVNNLHHLIAYRSQEEWDDENLPRGLGDGDFYGYPGELE